METLKMSLDEIVPSKTNPRKNFDKAEMAELEASIKQHGLVQPILVRPVGENGKVLFEIVAGERRFRAAKALGLTEIPVIQRELSDTEAREIQVIENLQRSDLHPLEEAEGYEGLMKSSGCSAEEVAARVGKSKPYVYSRLKLLALSKRPRKYFLEGILQVSVAFLLARIPDKRLQDQALDELVDEGCAPGEGPTLSRAREHIEHYYMTRLENAPFDTKDAKLFPKAGACTTCPKRTGNQKELFQDIKKADVCTDTRCFQEKRERAWALMVKAAKEKGIPVIEGEEAEKISAYGYVNRSSGYVDLNAKCHDDPKQRTWKQLARNALPPITLVRNSEGKVYELARERELLEALKKAGVKIKEDSPTNDDYRKEAAKQRAIARLKQAVFVKAVECLVKKVETYELKDFTALVAPMALRNASFEAQWPTAKRRGVVEKRSMDTREKLEKALGELSEPARKGCIVVLLVSGDRWSSYCGFGENFKLACKDAKVDLQKIEAEAKTELESVKHRRRKSR